MPAVKTLSTRDGVGARAHPSVIVGARASEWVLVPLDSAGTGAHERLREHAGAVSRIDR
jgi:hypothetical protein